MQKKSIRRLRLQNVRMWRLCAWGRIGKVEAEGRDRKDLNLPGAVQEDLLKAVVAANANTVVILLNAGPLAVSWVRAGRPTLW